jgi:hypothetical protein
MIEIKKKHFRDLLIYLLCINHAFFFVYPELQKKRAAYPAHVSSNNTAPCIGNLRRY